MAIRGDVRPSGPSPEVVAARAGLRRTQPPYGRRPRRPRRRVVVEALREFVRRYGWRAYAIPVLAALTVVVLATTSGEAPSRWNAAGGPHAPGVTGHGPTTPPLAAPHIALKHDSPGGNVDPSVLAAAALPPGPAYTKRGDGTYRVLPGSSPVVGSGHLYRYSIDVENGIDDVDVHHFENMVVSVLSDKRSWAGHGVSLERVDSGPIDFHVTLASSMTIRKVCGYTVHVETSCYMPAYGAPGVDVNRVEMNDARWVRGAAAYLGDLNAYRIYMINHEDGHALGHMHAHQCLPGGLAPVMMQQTFGLRSTEDNKLCQANPWPYPPGAQGAPGAEQPDTPQNDEYGKGD